MRELIVIQDIVKSMKKYAKEQLIDDERKKFKIKNIKTLIKTCLDFNATKEVIIERLIENCNISKKQAEEYLNIYNENWDKKYISELIELQDTEEELEIDKIKTLISLCLELNQDDNSIIDNLIEYCNISKEEAEEYLTMYNKGEL